MIIVSSGSGTVTNINTTLPLSGGPITTSGTITTSMATNKLIGRSTAGTGTMEEITVGTGLSLTGGTLSSTGGGAAGNTNEIQFNNAAAFAASGNLRWIIADNRIVLGTENTPDTNSRMVVVGKGISTNNTIAVHNSTGTNNSLIIKDDGSVVFGASTPGFGRYVFAFPGQSFQFKITDFQNTLTFYNSNSNASSGFNARFNVPQFSFYSGAGVGSFFGLRLGISTALTGTGRSILCIDTGVAPNTSPADAIQIYSEDITAGNAAPHFRTENGSIIKLYQETTAVTSATYVSGAGSNIKEDCTFDGYTVAQIVKALRNQGLLA